MARFESKAYVANRNLKSLCVCICSFAKREKIDVMLFRSVLHPSSEKKALAAFPTNGKFPKVKKKEKWLSDSGFTINEQSLQTH